MHQLQHLLSLTELYLSQQYAMSDWVFTNQETYSFFKNFALRLYSQKNGNITVREEDPLERVSHTISREDQPDVARLDSLTIAREHYPTDKATAIGSEDGPIDRSASPREYEKSGLKNKEKSENVSSPLPTSSEDVRPKVDRSHREMSFATKGNQPAKSNASQIVDIRYQELLLVHPHIAWVEFPPDDSRAKEVSQRWKTEKVSIDALLFSDGHREQHAFFIKIASAIKKYGKGALVSEISETLPHQPKIIIASRSLISKFPELKTRYPSCSLIEIANMTEMMKSPELKRKLWDQITTYLHIAT